MPYRSLNLEKTRGTLWKLVQRIEERFPESGLAQVARELHEISLEAESKVAWISTPNYYLRTGAGLLIVAILAVLALSFYTVDWRIGTFPMTEFIQVVEAGFNDLVLIGAAIFFLVSIETRVKRARVLASLNELRAIAHVIDMHQLTKDPTELTTPGRRASSVPRHNLTPFELNRYLDYCSELLSLVSKIASIYAQNFPDGTVVSAINELEALTTGLSRKVWQKIVILQGTEGSDTGATPLSTTPPKASPATKKSPAKSRSRKKATKSLIPAKARVKAAAPAKTTKGKI